MSVITRESLLSLEMYESQRGYWREKIIPHKRRRTVHVGPNITFLFEDEITIRYQIQEMLRIERTFEVEGIDDELDAYNPLVPNGRNLKATMLIEFPDPTVRAQQLQVLKGVERQTWMAVAGFEKIWAIADEDLKRENETKTSSVHFMRFEFSEDMVQALRQGAVLRMGIDHVNYQYVESSLSPETQGALLADFV
jgi:Protein of unknown function (DUF3501)